MSQPTPAPPARSRSRSSTMIIAAVIMAVSGIALLQQWLVAAPRRAYEDLLAAIRARGEPVTMIDLAPTPAANEDNAAVLYKQAFRLYIPPTPETEQYQEALTAWTSSGCEGAAPSQEALEAIAGWLGSNEPVLALMTQAATKPRCVFPLDWSAGINMRLDHLGQIRDLSRLTLTAADLALARGDAGASLAHSQTSLDLSFALKEEPCLISMLVHATMAIGAMEHLAAAMDAGAWPSENHARVLTRQLRDIDDPRTLERCLIGERAFGLSAFAMLEGGDVPANVGFTNNANFALYPSPLLLRDKLSYLSKMEAAIEIVRTSPEKQLTTLLQDLVKDLSSGLGQITIVTGMLLPAMEKVAEHQLSLQRQARQLALDLAAIRYHTRHGSPPESLETLVKEGLLEAVPMDAQGEPMILTPPATAEAGEGR